MADTLCGYLDRDEVLVAYLYDDMDPATRATFDAHLGICARCRQEIADLRAVREGLSQWAVAGGPAGAGAEGVAAALEAERAMGERSLPARADSWWRAVPVWARTAAAFLAIGAAAGLANLDVRYDSQGLVVHTGWMTSSPARAAAAAARASAAGAITTADAAPWRPELTALERQLRSEFRAANASAAAPSPVRSAASSTDAELLRRVSAMIDASEKRERTELALRIAEAYNNMRAQRNADLIKVDSVLGALKSDTNNELLRQRASINYLVTATQKQ
jgi:hypothetical protein